MSTLVMAAVWPLRMPPTNKAVLVSLADQANDQGACWPAVATLCERTCLGERTVRNALRWLEKQGLLETDKRRKRDGSMNSNLYTVHLAACRAMAATQQTEAAASPAAGGGMAPRGDDRAPASDAAATGTSCPTPPAPDAASHRHVVPHPPARGAPPPGTTCPLTIIEPTTEPNTPPTPLAGGRRAAAELIGLKAMLAQCAERGEKAIPPDDPVFAYAAGVGISRDILLLHWVEFKRRRGESGKRQRGVDGWRRAFRNSVRDNWFRLWFIRPGEAAQLTTVGLQAQAEQRAADAERAAGSGGQGEGGSHA